MTASVDAIIRRAAEGGYFDTEYSHYRYSHTYSDAETDSFVAILEKIDSLVGLPALSSYEAAFWLWLVVDIASASYKHLRPHRREMTEHFADRTRRAYALTLEGSTTSARSTKVSE